MLRYRLEFVRPRWATAARPRLPGRTDPARHGRAVRRDTVCRGVRPREHGTPGGAASESDRL